MRSTPSIQSPTAARGLQPGCVAACSSATRALVTLHVGPPVPSATSLPAESSPADSLVLGTSLVSRWVPCIQQQVFDAGSVAARLTACVPTRHSAKALPSVSSSRTILTQPRSGRHGHSGCADSADSLAGAQQRLLHVQGQVAGAGSSESCPLPGAAGLLLLKSFFVWRQPFELLCVVPT